MDGAQQWLLIAANGGHVRAMTLLGLYYAEYGDQANAVTWFTRAADAGEESAMNFLGAMYDAQGDLAAAVQWWGRAAQLGNSQAMYNLGELLIAAGYTQDGEGWVRAAAEAGHARAMTRLGELVPKTTIPEQRAEPATEQWYGGRMADSAPYDRGPSYQHGTRERWYGEATCAPEPRESAHGLAASTSGFKAISGFADTPGFTATPGFAGAGYLDQYRGL